MCGIFGIINSKESSHPKKSIKHSFEKIANLSKTRGKDSSGICVYDNLKKVIDVIKGPIPIDKLLNHPKSQRIISNSLNDSNSFDLLFGHARLVTNGSQLNDVNNQPIVKDGIIAIHNGIIVNSEKLWSQDTSLEKRYDIDTEILLSLINKEISKNISPESAVKNAIDRISGTASVAIGFNNLNKFILASNNGSLYTLTNDNDILMFASEKNILSKLFSKIKIEDKKDFKIKNIGGGEGISIDLDDFTMQSFSTSNESASSQVMKNKVTYNINIETVHADSKQKEVVVDLNKIHLNPKFSEENSLLIYPEDEIKNLKRCTRCILPETFPFIVFDSHGECNYCKNYIYENNNKSISALEELVEPYRKKNNNPEVLVPISGGRDSCYVLHVIKKMMDLKVVTYTYDWGMVTDLARRNIARICGDLQVENIIVSADLEWKRNNIKKNILAWLKYPSLGMIPLFMAGDKYFFYYAYKIKKQMDIDLEIWGVNKLENTNFKTGFAGLQPEFDKKHIYSLSLKNKINLFSFVAYNSLRSPGYLNQSVLDSLGSFVSRYMIPKVNYFHLFDYLPWDEKEVENTIINVYDWEKSIDTSSTWRIGDGTASFYNYIYTLLCGFSENDTFRSNQIRSGLISREDALNLVYKENQPRYNSLKWYFEIIGLDFSSVIKKVNNMERLY